MQPRPSPARILASREKIIHLVATSNLFIHQVFGIFNQTAGPPRSETVTDMQNPHRFSPATSPGHTLQVHISTRNLNDNDG